MNETLLVPHSIDNTISLLHFEDESDPYKDKYNNLTWSGTKHSIVTNEAKTWFNKKAAYVNSGATTGILKEPFDGDFTFEFFADYNSRNNSTGYRLPILWNNNNAYISALAWWYNHSNLTLSVGMDDGTALMSGGKSGSDVSVPIGHKGHIAFQRRENDFELYYNGKKVWTKSSDKKATLYKIEYYANGWSYYLDELRLSNIARYDGDFSVTTEQWR